MRCTAAVTNQFHIAAARHLVISPPALHGHRPFPITKTLLDFLIGEIGLRAHPIAGPARARATPPDSVRRPGSATHARPPGEIRRVLSAASHPQRPPTRRRG